MKQYNFYVYIVASATGVIYVGVTNNLIRRIEEHRNGVVEGFSKKYKTNELVYYEYFRDVNYAIKREKELKGWRREKKVVLIEKTNPSWNNLYDKLIGGDPSSP